MEPTVTTALPQVLLWGSVLGVLTLGAVVSFRQYLIHSQTLHRATLASRERRSDDYNGVLRELKTSVALSAENQALTVASLDQLSREMSGMSLAVKALVAKGGGKLSVADSQRIVEIELRNVRLSMSRTIQRSLYHNHFLGNELPIKTKVWRKLSEIINASLDNLKHVNISVDRSLVFSQTMIDGVPEYDLVAACWEAIVPLYDDVIEKTDPAYKARQGAKLLRASQLLREVFTHALGRISRRVEEAYGDEDDTHLDLQMIMRSTEQEVLDVAVGSSSDSYRTIPTAKSKVRV